MPCEAKNGSGLQVRRLAFLLMALASCWATTRGEAQTVGGSLGQISARTAADLIEINARWRELVDTARAEPTPFSQAGIRVLSQSLANIYARPATDRNAALNELRSGVLARLLPPGQLKKYCTEIARIGTDIVSTSADAPIQAVLPTEIVHAGPAVTAIATELPALLDRIERLADRSADAILLELRDRLLAALQMQRQRAALAMVAQSAPALLRERLDRIVPLNELLSKLPERFANVELCPESRQNWTALPIVDSVLRGQLARLQKEVDDFFAGADSQLKRSLAQAEEALSTLPPFNITIEPQLPSNVPPDALAKAWRVVFEYTPGALDGYGAVELVATNQALGLRIPLGIRIDRVRRTAAGGWEYSPDPVLQSLRVDGAGVAAALGEIGLASWARIETATLDVGRDLREIKLDLKVVVPAVNVSLPFIVVLTDPDKLIDLKSALDLLAKNAASKLADELKQRPPRISTGWGMLDIAVSEVVSTQTLEGGPWQLQVRGTITPSGAPDIGVDLVAEIGPTGDRPLRVLRAAPRPGLGTRVLRSINETIDTAINALPTATGLPQEARAFLRRCLVLDGLEFAPGSNGEAVALYVSVLAGQVKQRVELGRGGLSELSSKVRATIAKPMAECIGLQVAAYEARSLLQLTETQIAAYAAELNAAELSVLGVRFKVSNLKRPAGKAGFLLDLLGNPGDGGAPIRFAGLELRLDLWKPGDPLQARALDFSGVDLAPEDIRRLVLAVAKLPRELIERVDVAVRDGRVRLTPHLTIEALGGAIAVPALEVELGVSEKDLRDAFLRTAEGAVAQILGARISALLPDLGRLGQPEIDDIGKSNFLPTEGRDARIVFRTVSDLEFVKVRWGITLEIDATGRSRVRIDRGDLEGAILNTALAEVQKLLKGIGASDNFRNISVVTKRPYGVMFDVVGDIGAFQVTLPNVRITPAGIKLSPQIKLAYRTPPIQIPPFFQASPIDVTIDLKSIANFEIGARITVSGDDYGIIAFIGRLRGKGSEKRLETEGLVKMGPVPLVKSSGAADFRQGVITLRTETVGELSKLIDVGDEITITAKPLSAEIAARAEVLNVGVQGRLRVEVGNGKAVATAGGVAKLLLGDASVDAVLDSRLRGTGVRGSLKIASIAEATLKVNPRVAEVALDFKGFRIRLIAPSALQLTPELLEQALKRLFDFKIDLDSLKNREIVVSLVDDSGRLSTDPIGGDPIDGKAADASPQNNTGNLNPPPLVSEGRGGDSKPVGEPPVGCGLPGSLMIESPGKFPGHVVEVTKAPNVYYYEWASRVAPIEVWSTIQGWKPLTCFTMHELDLPVFDLPDSHKPGERFTVASPYVQVLVDGAGRPYVMAWRRNQRPIPLTFDDETRAIVLAGAGTTSFLEATQRGHEVKGYARRLLRRHVNTALLATSAEKVVSVVKVQPQAKVFEAVGLNPVEGAIVMVEKDGRQALRLLFGGGNDDTPDPEISREMLLFGLLDEPAERKGQFGQLVLAAYAAGNRLIVRANDNGCILATADGTRTAANWRGRLFVATPSDLRAVELIEAKRTLGALEGAAAGPVMCRMIADAATDNPWEALSGGALGDHLSAFALGSRLGAPGWAARLVLRRTVPEAGAVAELPIRDGVGSDIEKKLNAWRLSGLLRDPALLSTPLDRAGQVQLLDTLVRPESEYQDRTLANPRGLF